MNSTGSPTPALPAGLFRWTVTTGLLGFAAYFTSGYVRGGPALTISLLAAYFVLRGRALPAARPLSTFLCFGALAFAGWQWREGVPGVVALCNLASITMVAQWMLIDDGRKARQSLLVASMPVLATAAMNVNFVLPAALFPFIAALLRSLDLLAQWQQESSVTMRFDRGRSLGDRWGPLARGAFFAIIVWAALFYTIPRQSATGISPAAGQRRLIGFTETIRLGDVGSLLADSTVVMRIRPVSKGEVRQELRQTLQQSYLRGRAFVGYRDGTWSRTGLTQSFIYPARWNREVPIGNFAGDPRPEMVFEILLENTDPPILFMPDQATHLLTDLSYLHRDDDGSLSFNRRRTGVQRYQARLKIGRPDLSPLEDSLLASMPPLPRFLEIYAIASDVTPRIRELSRQITTGEDSLFSIVRTIERYLQRNHRYAINDLPIEAGDPIEFFLFQSKRGFCEHFASAMVLMVRSLGIAARPVNGYTISEWNEFGQYFTVRQSDAHTWVEVFFPTHGWITFDPTPASRDPGWSFLDQFAQLREWWDQFEATWFHYVYRLDRENQLAGYRRLATRVSVLITSIRHSPRELLLSIAAMSLFLYIRQRRRLLRRQRTATGDAHHWIPDWYHAWSGLLCLPRADHETPREYHERLIAHNVFISTQAGRLDRLAQLVTTAAFASPEQAQAADTEALALVQELRPRPRVEVPQDHTAG